MNLTSYFNSNFQPLEVFSFPLKKIEEGTLPSSGIIPKEENNKQGDEVLSMPLSSDMTKRPSRVLRLILKKTKIHSILGECISDPRREASIVYPLPSLLMHGLLGLMLHLKSRHAMTDAAKLSPCFEPNISSLIETKQMPSAKTVEDLYISLNPSEAEQILPKLFSSLLRSKFFILHPEFKAMEDGLLLLIDAQVTHTYHENNQHPVKSCPYCLKRTRGDKSWWLHCDVTLSVAGLRGFHFPLFLYRVKAKAKTENLSDDDFKQECELSALPHLLEKFRHFFPRIKATIGADSLYVQATAMDLCKRYNLGFVITRKEGSLRSLSCEVEGLKKFEKPFSRQYSQKRFIIKQEAYFFDNLSHKGHKFALIDLHEIAVKKPSKRYAKVTEKTSHWQWITTITEVWEAVQKGRLRWHQEDFNNSLNNRGFFFGHDFSRHPNSQTIWRFLTLIAFALSTLMTLSSLGTVSRKGCSIVNWIAAICSEIRNISTEFIMKIPMPRQMRFWNDTS